MLAGVSVRQAWTRRVLLTGVLVVGSLAACSSDSDESPVGSSSTTVAETSSTDVVSTDTVAPTAPTNGEADLVPGQPCALGSHVDCVDLDGDGEGTYLVNGGDCLENPQDYIACEDLDGDGYAGYPDSG